MISGGIEPTICALKEHLPNHLEEETKLHTHEERITFCLRPILFIYRIRDMDISLVYRLRSWPSMRLMELVRIELTASSLQGTRSFQLNYNPKYISCAMCQWRRPHAHPQPPFKFLTRLTIKRNDLSEVAVNIGLTI